MKENRCGKSKERKRERSARTTRAVQRCSKVAVESVSGDTGNNAGQSRYRVRSPFESVLVSHFDRLVFDMGIRAREERSTK